SDRNLKFAERFRKRLDADLVSAGFVRGVGHPAWGRFRRETPPTLIKRRLQVRPRLGVWRKSSLGRHGNNPQVRSALRSSCMVQGQATAARTVDGKLAVRRVGELFLCPSPARLFAKKVPG